jgi:ubiquinone/menaquinone biosynthesis C-methylase UbiE
MDPKKRIDGILDGMQPSISENNGLACMGEGDLSIYSVGISTGGSAEMRMALASDARRIIATTIDKEGLRFARDRIEKAGLSERIEAKLEDVSSPLPYPDGNFDFIYARLVLHYLSKKNLIQALQELYRVLKSSGKIFAVVRSSNCYEASAPDAVLDPETGMTAYRSHGQAYSRLFHTADSLQNSLKDAGFCIEHVKTYDEQLCVDFQRTQPAWREDSLIEVLAKK